MLDEFLGVWKGIILYGWRRGLILFPRSERAKSDPRSIDTLRAPFSAVLMPESCVYAVEKCGCSRGPKTDAHFAEKVIEPDSGGWGYRCKTASRVGRAGGFSIDVRTICDTYPAAMLRRGGMHLKNDPLRSSILMSGNTKHLAKKCVKDARAVSCAVRGRRGGRAAGCSGTI